MNLLRPSLRIALLQTAPQLGAMDINLAGLHDQLRQVATADLAVAPELATHGYHIGELDDTDGLSAGDERIIELGRHGPAIVAGFIEVWRHHRYNSAAIVDGERVYVQRKLYLPTYRGWEERKHFRPGNRVNCFDLRGTRVAVLICNDLWQPPLPWLCAHAGAEVLVVVANSLRGESAVAIQKVWDLLIAHTAVVLQMYVVFVNRAGTECGADFWGGSRVVAPDGELVVRLGGDPDQVEVDVDLAALRSLRRRWPLVQESRFDLVSSESLRLASDEQG